MPSTVTDRLTGISTSVAVKAPCRVATTANITLSGAQTIDGVAVVADDRVLVKDQTDTTQNGIYWASSTAWERTPDFDGSRDVVTGTLVYIVSGTAYGNSFWRVSTSGDPTPGDAMAFSQSNLSLAGITSFWQGILALTSTAASLTALGISVFMQTVLDDSSAVQARQTLGFPSTGLTDGLATVNSSGMYRGSTITTLSTDGVLKGHYSGVSRTTSTAITLGASDAGTLIILGASSTAIVTAPSSTSALLNKGFQVALAQESSASISLAVQAADSPLRSKLSRNFLSAQYSPVSLVKYSSTAGSWLAMGDLST